MRKGSIFFFSLGVYFFSSFFLRKYLFKYRISCFVGLFENRNHQFLEDAEKIPISFTLILTSDQVARRGFRVAFFPLF